MCLKHLLLLCVIRAANTARTCFEVSPKGDVFITAGSELHVNCSLKMFVNGIDCVDRYNIYNISIRKGSKEIASELIEYFPEKKTLALTIRNATFEDDGFYTCVYDGNIESAMGMRVGEPPGAPENLSCISRNFNDMSCSFALSRKRVNIPTVNIIQFKLNSQNWSTIPKTNYDCNKSMCTFWLDSRTDTSSPYTFMPSARYKIRAVALNKLGRNSTDLVIGPTESIVKPNPVENIDFTKFSRRVRLRWSCTNDLTYLNSTFITMDYKIVITSEWQRRVLLVQNRTTAAIEYHIEKLIPFTNYTVTVQAKPSAAVLDIYWSDTMAVTFVTLSTVPEHAVSVTAGSYMMVDPGSLVLYWKNPARRYWYGSITGYQITLEEIVLSENLVEELGRKNKGYIRKHSLHIHGLEPLSENVEGVAVSAVLNRELRGESSYQVGIRVTNTKGVSSNRSEMIVPNRNIGQLLRPKWVSVEIAESSVYIEWYMNPEYCAAITSVTYYWCHVDSIYPFSNSNVSCQEKFDWESVNISNGCGHGISHEIQNSADPRDMKYAISVQASSELSGGMAWEKFRFSKYNVPEKPLYAVSTDSTNFKVQILYDDYHTSKGGRPDNYSVEYSECLQSEDCHTGVSNEIVRVFPANFMDPVYMIGKLKPGSQYRVRVSSDNSLGRSEYGKPFMITFIDENDAIAETVGGIAGVIVFVLLLFLICYGRKRYNDLKIGASIKMPDTLQVDEMTNMVEDRISMMSADHDSGKGTDSLRSSVDDTTCQQTRSRSSLEEDESLVAEKMQLTEQCCSGYVTEVPVKETSTLNLELKKQEYVLHCTEMNIRRTPEKPCYNTDYVTAFPDTVPYIRIGELKPEKGEINALGNLPNESTCDLSRSNISQESETEIFHFDRVNYQRKKGYVLNSDDALLEELLDNRMANASVGTKDCLSNAPNEFISEIENALGRKQDVKAADMENLYVLERDHFPPEQRRAKDWTMHVILSNECISLSDAEINLKQICEDIPPEENVDVENVCSSLVHADAHEVSDYVYKVN